MAENSRATHGESLCCPVELREAEDGPMLHGVLIQEGRAASVRPEVFAPRSLVWAGDGIALRAKHLGAEDSRAIPTREANGEIRIAAPASKAIVAAFNEGRKFLSIEFNSLKETRTAAGVREILLRVPCRARPLSPIQSTSKRRAEVRARQRREILAMSVLSKLFRRRSPEVRESSYTDMAVARIMSASAGVGEGSTALALASD